MAFTNLQVALSELPTFEDIEFTDLDPSYAWLVCGVVVVVEILLTGIALIFFSEFEIPQEIRERFWYAVVGLLGCFVLFPLYKFKATRAIRYAIRDHDVVLQSGLVWLSEVVQPIRRIQHVELTRGPVEKRLGLANVRLFSAGSGKATFTIPGLRLITAARIRRYVLQAGRR